jgi:signal peptidase I
MGDNRNHSTDSRAPQVGTVDERDVLGRALLVLFPFQRLGGVA